MRRIDVVSARTRWFIAFAALLALLPVLPVPEFWITQFAIVFRVMDAPYCFQSFS